MSLADRSLHRSAVALLAALAAAAGLGIAPAAAQTESVGADACNRDTLISLIDARDPEIFEYVDLEAMPDLLGITCTNVNGDDIPDALWWLANGGSGGAFYAGVTVSAPTGGSASIVHWVQHSHLVTGFVGGKPAIGSPRYRKSDANCCPTGGWRWRTYTPTADGGVKQSKLKTTRKRRSPIRAGR